MKTGIIIPCYNEASRLNSKAFVDFILTNDDYHLCFVNDGSKDNTLQILNSLQSTCPSKITVLDSKLNEGKATAVRSGANFLYNKEDINYIGFIDADLSTDFEDFDRLVQSLKSNKELKMIYGSRRKGGNIERSFFRGFLSKIIKSIIYLILGLPIEDTQCGAKVFRRDLIPVAFEQSFLTRWLFDVEIFIRIKNIYGQEIMEVTREQALERWVHVDDSKLGVKDSLLIPYRLLTIWLAYNLNVPTLSIRL